MSAFAQEEDEGARFAAGVCFPFSLLKRRRLIYSGLYEKPLNANAQGNAHE
jgi:hypothetical protein